MASVPSQPQPSLMVRNTFLYCAEEEESPAVHAVVARPRSRTGPASLFAGMLLELGLDDVDAPRGAKAAADSQASEEACSTSETGEWDDDERPLPIRSMRGHDLFEEAPPRSVSVRTLDPFDDAPAQEMTREQFQHAVHYGAPQSPPAQRGAQAPGGSSELRRVASRTDGVASTTLRAGVVAKIRIRNTFVDFLSDDEGEETPTLRSGLQRRARATRTVPARILEEALWHEEPAAEQGTPAAPPREEAPPSRAEALPAARPQDRQLQRGLRDDGLRDDGPAAEAAKVELKPGVTVAFVEEPVFEPAPAAKATTPEPMYVEQTPSTLTAAPRKLRLAEEQTAAERGPRLTVRNTFLHIDDEAEDAEETPVCHRRSDRRSKTGPAGTLVLDDVSDQSDEVGARMAAVAAAGQPCKVPMAQERPRDATTCSPAQVAGPADSTMGMAAPPGMCMPFPLPPAVVPLAGFGAMAPFLAQISAAQAVQLCHPVAAQVATAPPEVEQPTAKTSAIGSSSRRSNADRTTVVLQNLPLNYRRAMLLRMLDAEGFAGDYDFVYLPMDFKTRAGFGYAFINLVDPTVVARFWNVFDGYNKWVFPSAKVCKVSWSVPHQGLKAHIKRYRNSPLMHESVPDEYKPVLFAAGTRVAFPPPMKEIVAPSQKVLAKAPRRGRK